MWWNEKFSFKLSEKDDKLGDDTIGDIGLGATDCDDCKVEPYPKWSTIVQIICDPHSQKKKYFVMK